MEPVIAKVDAPPDGFKQTEIGLIPEEWEVAQLADVCQKAKQRTPQADEEFDYIDVSSVSNESFKIIGSTRHKGSSAPSRARKPIQADDVLFATVRPTLKRVAMVPQHLDRQVCSTAFCVIRANPGLSDSAFLYHLLLTNELNSRIAERQHGSSYPAVTDSDVLNQKIIVPPLPEQRGIAHVLSKIQAAAQAQAAIAKRARELKRALMAKLFTEGLRGEPLKETEIGQVPTSWNVSRLDNFCVLQRGFDITKADQIPGDVPVVSSGGVSSHHNIAKIKSPGVVIGRKGSLGTVHYMEVDFWPHDTTLWVKDFMGNDPLFTAYFLETLHLEKYNSGASNPTLNRNTVHAELVSFPTTDEQREIARILKAVDAKITAAERKRVGLEELFRAMLGELMTGRVRVTGWVEEPGGVASHLQAGRFRQIL